PPLDAARDHRHHAAARAHVELRRAGAEGISADLSRVLDADAQAAARMGGPHPAVLDAERAAALARGNRARLAVEAEREGNVAAVGAAGELHRPIRPVADSPRAPASPGRRSTSPSPPRGTCAPWARWA